MCRFVVQLAGNHLRSCAYGLITVRNNRALQFGNSSPSGGGTFVVMLDNSVPGLFYSVLKVITVRPHPGPFLEAGQGVVEISLLQE